MIPVAPPEARTEWRAILDVLVRADHAWQTPAALAKRLGRDVERLTDTLAEMDRGGWLALWERPDGVLVTLSAWAAQRLGARLVEAGGPGRWRWLRCAGSRDPRGPVGRTARPRTGRIALPAGAGSA
jgi:hypothetical protein